MTYFAESVLLIVGLYTVARWTLRAAAALVEMSHAESVARRGAGRQVGRIAGPMSWAYETTRGDSGTLVRK